MFTERIEPIDILVYIILEPKILYVHPSLKIYNSRNIFLLFFILPFCVNISPYSYSAFTLNYTIVYMLCILCNYVNYGAMQIYYYCIFLLYSEPT